MNEKRGDNQNTHSLSNSISAKMLAGSKAYHKKIKESGYDKVSINDLIQKKKSVEVVRKEKEPVWKQMVGHKAGEMKDKLIRF
jgi:hypothetical protein